MNEIETIFCKLLKCDRSSLYLDKHKPLLAGAQYNRLQNFLKKRISGEPLQYLVGDVDFMGLKLKVKPGVLIPRPETELLVAEAIKAIASGHCAHPRILDIGTGSGNIAVALAKNLEEAEVASVDISEACLSLAKINAKHNHVQDRIIFYRSDIFECFKENAPVFDYIISNPPYISPKEYQHLPQDVQREPVLALVAEDDGLYFYKKIEEGARKFLASGGGIFLEIGQGQAAGLKKIFSDATVWQEVEFINDFSGIKRIAVIKKS